MDRSVLGKLSFAKRKNVCFETSALNRVNALAGVSKGSGSGAPSLRVEGWGCRARFSSAPPLPPCDLGHLFTSLSLVPSPQWGHRFLTSRLLGIDLFFHLCLFFSEFIPLLFPPINIGVIKLWGW